MLLLLLSCWRDFPRYLEYSCARRHGACWRVARVERLWFGRWRQQLAIVECTHANWQSMLNGSDGLERETPVTWSRAMKYTQQTIGKMKIVIEMCEKASWEDSKFQLSTYMRSASFFIPLFNCGVSLCFKELFSLLVCRQIKFHYILIVPSINSSHIRLEDDGAHKSRHRINAISFTPQTHLTTSLTSPSLSIHKL